MERRPYINRNSSKNYNTTETEVEMKSGTIELKTDVLTNEDEDGEKMDNPA